MANDINIGMPEAMLRNNSENTTIVISTYTRRFAAIIPDTAPKFPQITDCH
jgi:hypothetical protein